MAMSTPVSTASTAADGSGQAAGAGSRHEGRQRTRVADPWLEEVLRAGTNMSNSLEERLAVVNGRLIKSLTRYYYRYEQLCRAWSAVEPHLKAPEPEARTTGFAVMDVMNRRHYDELKTLRAEFLYVIVQHPGDYNLRQRSLAALIDDGRRIDPFAPDFGRLTAAWLHETEDYAGLLALLCTVIKTAFHSLEHRVVLHVAKHVARLCISAVEAGNADLVGGCLQVFDALVKYGSVPRRALPVVVEALCASVNLSPDTWRLVRNLLGTSAGHRTFQELLDRVARCGSIPGAQMSRLDLTVVRGAVFCVGMSRWGSQRVKTLKYPFCAVLPALLKALDCQNAVVVYEIVLSLQRLLKKYGSALVVEWDTVLQMMLKLKVWLSAAADSGGGGAMKGSTADSGGSPAVGSSAVRTPPRRRRSFAAGGSAMKETPRMDRNRSARSVLSAGEPGRTADTNSVPRKASSRAIDGIDLREGGEGGRSSDGSRAPSPASPASPQVTSVQKTRIPQEVLVLLSIIQEHYETEAYNGSEEYFFGVMFSYARFAPPAALKLLLKRLGDLATPGHPDWVAALGAIVELFQLAGERGMVSVRRDTLDTVHAVWWRCRYIYDEEVILGALHPLLSKIHCDPDASVRSKGISLLVSTVRHTTAIGDDDVLVEDLFRTVTDSVYGDTAVGAVKGLATVFATVLEYPPASRGVDIFEKLTSLVNGRYAEDIRMVALQTLARVQCNSRYQIQYVDSQTRTSPFLYSSASRAPKGGTALQVWRFVEALGTTLTRERNPVLFFSTLSVISAAVLNHYIAVDVPRGFLCLVLSASLSARVFGSQLRESPVSGGFAPVQRGSPVSGVSTEVAARAHERQDSGPRDSSPSPSPSPSPPHSPSRSPSGSPRGSADSRADAHREGEEGRGTAEAGDDSDVADQSPSVAGLELSEMFAGGADLHQKRPTGRALRRRHTTTSAADAAAAAAKVREMKRSKKDRGKRSSGDSRRTAGPPGAGRLKDVGLRLEALSRGFSLLGVLVGGAKVLPRDARECMVGTFVNGLHILNIFAGVSTGTLDPRLHPLEPASGAGELLRSISVLPTERTMQLVEFARNIVTAQLAGHPGPTSDFGAPLSISSSGGPAKASFSPPTPSRGARGEHSLSSSHLLRRRRSHDSGVEPSSSGEPGSQTGLSGFAALPRTPQFGEDLPGPSGAAAYLARHVDNSQPFKVPQVSQSSLIDFAHTLTSGLAMCGSNLRVELLAVATPFFEALQTLLGTGSSAWRRKVCVPVMQLLYNLVTLEGWVAELSAQQQALLVHLALLFSDSSSEPEHAVVLAYRVLSSTFLKLSRDGKLRVLPDLHKALAAHTSARQCHYAAALWALVSGYMHADPASVPIRAAPPPTFAHELGFVPSAAELGVSSFESLDIRAIGDEAGEVPPWTPPVLSEEEQSRLPTQLFLRGHSLVQVRTGALARCDVTVRHGSGCTRWVMNVSSADTSLWPDPPSVVVVPRQATPPPPHGADEGHGHAEEGDYESAPVTPADEEKAPDTMAKQRLETRKESGVHVAADDISTAHEVARLGVDGDTEPLSAEPSRKGGGRRSLPGRGQSEMLKFGEHLSARAREGTAGGEGLFRTRERAASTGNLVGLAAASSADAEAAATLARNQGPILFADKPLPSYDSLGTSPSLFVTKATARRDLRRRRNRRRVLSEDIPQSAQSLIDPVVPSQVGDTTDGATVDGAANGSKHDDVATGSDGVAAGSDEDGAATGRKEDGEATKSKQHGAASGNKGDGAETGSKEDVTAAATSPTAKGGAAGKGGLSPASKPSVASPSVRTPMSSASGGGGNVFSDESNTSGAAKALLDAFSPSSAVSAKSNRAVAGRGSPTLPVVLSPTGTGHEVGKVHSSDARAPGTHRIQSPLGESTAPSKGPAAAVIAASRLAWPLSPGQIDELADTLPPSPRNTSRQSRKKFDFAGSKESESRTNRGASKVSDASSRVAPAATAVDSRRDESMQHRPRATSGYVTEGANLQASGGSVTAQPSSGVTSERDHGSVATPTVATPVKSRTPPMQLRMTKSAEQLKRHHEVDAGGTGSAVGGSTAASGASGGAGGTGGAIPELPDTAGETSAPDPTADVAAGQRMAEWLGPVAPPAVPASIEMGRELASSGSGAPFDPTFVLSQLQQWPSEDNSLVPLGSSEQLRRAISVLDRTPAVETHKVGVVYVGAKQTAEADILGNQTGSSAYDRLLSHLGHFVRLKGCEHYTGGLDTRDNTDGEYALIWHAPGLQLVYHVATLMPGDGKRCTSKKRHIGNNYVTVAYVEDGGKFGHDTLPSHFNFVLILVRALDDSTFHISVKRKPDVPRTGPVLQESVVDSGSVGDIVRQCVLQADLACRIMHGGRLMPMSNPVARVEQLARIRERLLRDEQAKPFD